MKRTHLGLAGLVLGTVLFQVGCANMPQTTGAAPEDTQAMKDHEAVMAIAGLPVTTKTVALGAIGDPLPGLTQAQLAIFGQGKAVFSKTFTMEPGDFANDRSCLACHGAGGAGGASDHFAANIAQVPNPRNEDDAAAGLALVNGQLVPNFLQLGFLGHLLSNDPAHNPQPLPKPNAGNSLLVSNRLAPPTAGDGVLVSIPEYQLRARAAAYKPFGIKGVVGEVDADGPGPGTATIAGRIGWKLRTPTVAGFNGGAFINELGVSDNIVPGLALEQRFDGSLTPDDNGPDVSDNDVAAVNLFTELSMPPAPQKLNVAGLNAFKKAGCIECHWTGYTTAKTMDETPDEMKPFFNIVGGGKQVPAYTDLLAHKMGGGVLSPSTTKTGQSADPNGNPIFEHIDGLGNSDGIKETVSGEEYRTAPLWGLRFRPLYMHNGKAKTIDEAIRQHYYVSPYNHAHDSEANEVVLHYLGKTRNRKYDLSARERYELLSFLRQL